MSGHSKWSTIKRKKGMMDARKGQLFTKFGREIAVAARRGGGDPDSNFALRLVIEKAKQANMPKETIERAIKRGTGELKGKALEEVTYEGYGPQGAALMLQVLTDNRNRAVADIRRIFTQHNGSLGESGCVAWLFEQKGLISLEADGEDPEELALLAIDAGADDVQIDDDGFVQVYTKPSDFRAVKEALEQHHVPLLSAEISMVPKSLMRLDEKATIQTMSLIEALEGLDDAQYIYSNLDIPDEVISKYKGGK